MEHIDFYKKKYELHKEMCDAILQLMNEHGVTQIDLSQYDIDKAYGVNVFGDSVSDDVIRTIRVNNGLIEVQIDADWAEDVWLSLDDDFLMASFVTLYDAVYTLLEKLKIF